MPGSSSLAFCFMRHLFTKIVGMTLIVVLTIGLLWKISEAVVPPSTSIESKAKTERQKLMDVLGKIERHEEENINFIKDLRNEMKGLKT